MEKPLTFRLLVGGLCGIALVSVCFILWIGTMYFTAYMTEQKIEYHRTVCEEAYSKNQLELARQHCKVALTMAQKHWQATPTRTIRYLLMMSDLDQLHEDYPEAEALSQQALHIAETSAGKDSPKLVDILNNMGIAASRQEKYPEAIESYSRALNLIERHDPENPYRTSILNNLGEVYRHQRQFDKAMVYYQQGITIAKQYENTQNAHALAILMSSIAESYRDQGQYEKAQAYYQSSLQLCNKLFGENHPQTVEIRKELQAMEAQHPTGSKPSPTLESPATI